MSKNKKFEFGEPLNLNELPKPRRLQKYDECLREFIDSGYSLWRVNVETLPSNDLRVILSSLKWRLKNREEFKGKNLGVFMRNKQIYIKRESPIE